MDFQTLYREVGLNMRDPNLEKLNLDRIKRLLNQGEQRYCTLTSYSTKKDTSISTIAYQQEYSLPSDYKSLVAVFYDGVPLMRTELEFTIRNIPYYSSPTHYYVALNKIGFDPIPADVKMITLVYHSIGGDMSADNDVPIIPEEDHMILIFWACYWLAIEANDNRATAFIGYFNEGIRQAIQANNKKAFSHFPTVGEYPAYFINPIDHDVEGIL